MKFHSKMIIVYNALIMMEVNLNKIALLVEMKNVNLVIQTNQNFVVHVMMDIIYQKMIKPNVKNAL